MLTPSYHKEKNPPSDNISGGGMEGGENDGTDVKTTGKPVDGETKDGDNGEESVNSFFPHSLKIQLI